MVEQLTYALVVLFTLDGGHILAMDTLRDFDQSPTCIAVAARENARSADRAYVCVPRAEATPFAVRRRT